MDLQELLNSMEASFQRQIEMPCQHCGTPHKLTVEYKLIIDVFTIGSQKHYYAYYQSDNFYNLGGFQTIGINTGIGHKTLAEAILELKEILKSYKESEE